MVRPNSFWSKAKLQALLPDPKHAMDDAVNKGGAGWSSNNRSSQRLNRGQHTLQGLFGLLEVMAGLHPQPEPFGSAEEAA